MKKDLYESVVVPIADYAMKYYARGIPFLLNEVCFFIAGSEVVMVQRYCDIEYDIEEATGFKTNFISPCYLMEVKIKLPNHKEWEKTLWYVTDIETDIDNEKWERLIEE